MTPLLALPLALAAAGAAQIEAVSLALVDSRPALLLRCSTAPARVSVHRDGSVARISLLGVGLGSQFSGGDRFEWTRASVQAGHNGLFPLEAFRVERGDREVSLYLNVPPDVPIRVARAGANVAVLLEMPRPLRPEPQVTVARAEEKPAAPGPAKATGLPDEGAQVAVVEPVEAPAPADEGAQVAVVEPVEAPAPADEGAQVAVVEPVEAPAPIPTPELAAERLDREPMDEPKGAPSSGRQLSAELFPVPVPEDPPVADPAAPPGSRGAAELHARLFPPEGEEPPAVEGPGASPIGRPAADPREAAELYADLFPFESKGGRGELALAASLTGTPSGAVELADLYTRLFPSAPEDVEPQAASLEGEGLTEKQPGLVLGFLRLRPSLSLSFADAEVNSLDTPEPVSDQFLMVQPRLAAEGVLWDGRLSAGYEPIFRSFGSSDTVNSTSHRAYASLALQPGARWSLALSDQFITGTLETQEVDPGREYFFDLARFTRNAFSASSRFDVGPRLGVDLSAGFSRVRFQESAGYFGHDSVTAGADLGFELTPTLRAAVGYRFDLVPTPDDRPEAESRAHGGQLSLTGEILPLVTGELAVGYRSQQNPNAGEGGREFRGLTASGFLRKQIGRSSTLSLRLGRSTPLSAFEQNAFYVTTALEGILALPLPLSVAMTSGAGYRWNDYRTVAAELGVPREDRIFSWFVGLRRSLSRRAHASVVYSRERRDSNLDGFSNVNEGLSLQLNVDVYQGWNAP